MTRLFKLREHPGWMQSLQRIGYQKRYNERQHCPDFVLRVNHKRPFPRFHIFTWRDPEQNQLCIDLHYDKFQAYHDPVYAMEYVPGGLRTAYYTGHQVEAEMERIAVAINKG